MEGRENNSESKDTIEFVEPASSASSKPLSWGLALVAVISVAGIAWLYIFSAQILFPYLPPKQRLAVLFERDLNRLERNEALPPRWSDVAQVSWVATDQLSKSWKPVLEPFIEFNPNGRTRLEIIMTPWRDNKGFGSVIQFSLIDLKTGNLLHEFGRTYDLSQGNVEEAKNWDDKDPIANAAPPAAKEPAKN